MLARLSRKLDVGHAFSPGLVDRRVCITEYPVRGAVDNPDVRSVGGDSLGADEAAGPPTADYFSLAVVDEHVRSGPLGGVDDPLPIPRRIAGNAARTRVGLIERLFFRHTHRKRRRRTHRDRPDRPRRTWSSPDTNCPTCAASAIGPGTVTDNSWRDSRFSTRSVRLLNCCGDFALSRRQSNTFPSPQVHREPRNDRPMIAPPS